MESRIIERIRTKASNLDDASILKVYREIRSEITNDKTSGIYFRDMSIDPEVAEDCRLYFDFDNGFGRYVPLERCAEFESTHMVVTGPEFSFGYLQPRYICDLVKEGEGPALENLTDNCKKKGSL